MKTPYQYYNSLSSPVKLEYSPCWTVHRTPKKTNLTKGPNTSQILKALSILYKQSVEPDCILPVDLTNTLFCLTLAFSLVKKCSRPNTTQEKYFKNIDIPKWILSRVLRLSTDCESKTNNDRMLTCLRKRGPRKRSSRKTLRAHNISFCITALYSVSFNPLTVSIM